MDYTFLDMISVDDEHLQQLLRLVCLTIVIFVYLNFFPGLPIRLVGFLAIKYSFVLNIHNKYFQLKSLFF